MNIAVIGTGYVGLVTGTCLAETGNSVICVDTNKSKVKDLQAGKIPIYEPHLDSLFLRNIKAGRLKFTIHLDEVIDQSEIIFLALPTPPGEDGSADLSYVLGVADRLGEKMKGYKVIVNKSTVPVGTAEKVKKHIRKNFKGNFDVVSNPEFLREGFAVDDFMKPDRVVIGCSSEKAAATMKELFAPFVRQGNPVYFMDERSAELTKYAANAFLATKISFMNEIANLCELTGANVDAVRIGIGSDERIGKRFLFAGIGYGGSCFPKDVHALVKISEENKYRFRILESVMEVNKRQKEIIVRKIVKYFSGKLSGKKIAVWGLAFKPDTDDIREAPALEIIRELLDAGANVSVFDPQAMESAKKILGKTVTFARNQYDALQDADALVIATEWAEFRSPDFDRIASRMKKKTIFDGRNLYEPEHMAKSGYAYFSIGRKMTGPSL